MITTHKNIKCRFSKHWLHRQVTRLIKTTFEIKANQEKFFLKIMHIALITDQSSGTKMDIPKQYFKLVKETLSS